MSDMATVGTDVARPARVSAPSLPEAHRTLRVFSAADGGQPWWR